MTTTVEDDLPTPATFAVSEEGTVPAHVRRRESARQRFPARAVAPEWPATRLPRDEVQQLLAAPPLALGKGDGRTHSALGLVTLLDWLEGQPGRTWQARWQVSGIEDSGAEWRREIAQWLPTRGLDKPWRVHAFSSALAAVISADLVRPSTRWLVTGATGRGVLVRNLARARDPEGFARLRELGDTGPDVRPPDAKLALHRTAVILAAKGGTVTDITVGDVVELLDAEAAAHLKVTSGAHSFYYLLRRIGAFDAEAPETLRGIRNLGQRTPEELIDRYGLRCRPVRDLLVDYLRERQPVLDYASLKSLSYHLGKHFWQALECHHPGIDSLRPAPDVAEAWKQRLRTKPKKVTGPDGHTREIRVERINYRECLTPVRAFYLDIAQWALEDPARWGPWVAPCPVREEEVSRRKVARKRKARMDARTRERLPVLPVLTRTVDRRRKDAAALLETARQTPPGQVFTAAGQELARAVVPHGAAGKIWAEDPATGKRRDLSLEEERAFWTWAAVEVLRATGIRIEELLELSHHSLIQYRLPTTGELVPLLQIVPSKTDTERLLLVSPELADVLSTIIRRIRDASTAVPLVRSYDRTECTWREQAPLLFQRRRGTENRGFTDEAVRTLLAQALIDTGLADPATGEPLRYTPHDFRRLFVTDAIMNGLPPHIAQVICGHKNIDTTIGYKAVYPAETIEAHRAFIARRRASRPSEEYRIPTEEEWDAFLAHFEKRKVSIGTCARAFGSSCIHEHACVRCSLLRPDPAQRARLAEIRDNLIARIAEAEREGWLGEVEGLQISLAGAEEKLCQLDQAHGHHTPVDLGIPTTRGDR
ncbi:site-specific integrase [Streptomyces yunnanensis]|uniref:Phage integrase family protein n=1 Tax=Streptomyces yunnanensis TaxID=156453 RepID=A0A9X8QXY3_9ACTN|nr:site-specific integrase [Streptomyces yunnanensis]SHM93958.1 Phage integrase family protein [Streptomyces yunnanensis]